jgi:transcriptional regulator with XRE-family HTH domain
MKISPEHAMAARRLLGWSQSDLARIAGLTELAVHLFETRGRVAASTTISAIKRAFEAAGVKFGPGGAISPSLREQNGPALIVSDANGATEPVRKQFRTFREALHHFVTVLSREERDISYIVTADGKEWRRPDLLALYKHKISRSTGKAT